MSLTPEMVFILHAKQPLTTDPAAVLPGPDCEVTVLSDPTGGPALREDVGESRARVHHAPVGQWRETIVGLAGSRRFDVLTNDEYALLTCRDLRAGLGLPPRHPHQLIQYLDKVEMKRRLTACGIGTARFVEVDRVAADTPAEALVARLGLPVVAKPRQEANSRGVQVLRSVEEEVRRWQQRRHGQPAGTSRSTWRASRTTSTGSCMPGPSHPSKSGGTWGRCSTCRSGGGWVA
jgi:hypothetical protein